MMNDDWLQLFVHHTCLLREMSFNKEQKYGTTLEALKLLTNLIYNSSVALDYCIRYKIIDGVMNRLATIR